MQLLKKLRGTDLSQPGSQILHRPGSALNPIV